MFLDMLIWCLLAKINEIIGNYEQNIHEGTWIGCSPLAIYNPISYKCQDTAHLALHLILRT